MFDNYHTFFILHPILLKASQVEERNYLSGMKEDFLAGMIGAYVFV